MKGMGQRPGLVSESHVELLGNTQQAWRTDDLKRDFFCISFSVISRSFEEQIKVRL